MCSFMTNKYLKNMKKMQLVLFATNYASGKTVESNMNRDVIRQVLIQSSVLTATSVSNPSPLYNTTCVPNMQSPRIITVTNANFNVPLAKI